VSGNPLAVALAFTLGRSQIAVAKLQAGIAKRAWQTSNEKIVLDLFEKRLAIYEEIRATITPINSSGNTTDENFCKYCQSIDRAIFFRSGRFKLSRAHPDFADQSSTGLLHGFKRFDARSPRLGEAKNGII
jgi:hypothetical protein